MSTNDPAAAPHASKLAEVMEDPILDLILQGDGLSRADLTTMIEDMRHKLHLDHHDAAG